MVLPAHRVIGGLVLLAELSREQVDTLYEPERYAERPDERPDLRRLHRDLDLDSERALRPAPAAGARVRAECGGAGDRGGPAARRVLRVTTRRPT